MLREPHTNMIATKKPRLDAEQLEQYRREGYLLYKQNVFAPEKFDRLKAHFERLLAELPPDKRPEAMDVPHFTDTKLFEWLFDDDVLDLVEPILGPDIALFSSHFICKPKGDGRRVPWHEDSAYWNTMISPMEVVTVWLAIDESTPKNGCMYVIPHTHNTGRKGFSDYDQVDPMKNVFKTEVTPRQRDESKAVPCILEPNQCSLHDGRLMHGSPPNNSDKRRCGYTMRYIASSTRLSDDAREYHQIYLARGRDLAGQGFADPTKKYDDFYSQRIAKGRKGH
jgi:Phytanoyl-CoA dioxygenase (PhyH)